MKIQPIRATIAATVLALALFPINLQAQPIYSSGHADIGVGYAAGEFEPHWHLHSGAIVGGNPIAADEEYAPADLIAQVQATRLSPSGLQSIIGVTDGNTIFVMGSSAFQPNLGFGAEELVPADWTTPITLTLTGWTLPGGAQFALYTTNLAGTSVVDRVFSTFNGAATDFSNSFQMTPGDHVHFQWGFTEVGDYALELTWSGTHAMDGPISTTENFTVQVVPEPSTVFMLGLGAVGFLLLLRRRARLSN
ncbi:MAG: choice-of-anchor M domain-containing protein [Chthoniobacterales bacterium]